MESPRRPASPKETRVAWATLAALAVVATALAWKQSSYDPARFRMGLARADAPGSELALPAGAVAATPPENFDAATLSDKIDGRADLYLTLGFRSLSCRRFAATGGDPDLVEACVYDLSEPSNAYSAWSRQRREGAPDAGIGRHSYRTSNGLFLATDRFYLEVLATRGGSEAMTLAHRFASDFAAGHPDPAGQPGADSPASTFPVEGKVDGSEALLKESAFGSSSLDRVMMARYRSGESEATAFLSRRADPGEASSLSEAWRRELLSQGAHPADPPRGIPGAWAVDAEGWIEIAFVRGRVLAGVHEGEDRGRADALARALYENLAGESP